MTKKKDEKKAADKSSKKYSKGLPVNNPGDAMKKQAEALGLANLPADAKKRLESIKKIVDKFQKELLKKFEEYVMGVTLLPPKKNDKGVVADKDAINLLVLIDDTDSKRMSKLELKEKLTSIIKELAKNTDKNLDVEIVILSEVWQGCYDAKYDLLELIASGAEVFDKGMLAAIKISQIHKVMTLKKFEKYIVSYVLAGSLVQGKATPESDIDVFLVIDDTDVKKMTRAELKDKLRAIITGMGLEAAELTGIRNKLNIQVYILTDFWENIKEANPIIFTFLRDGIPFYDRGIFMPWKQLLKMGKIKPSPEAIDMMMSSGEQMLNRVELRIKEIGMEDIFYALLMPSQAAIMLYGIPPPTPKETPGLLREIFVKKEKLLEEKYVKTLEEVIQVRKDLEHGTMKKFTGTQLDRLLKESHDYLHRITELFSQIDRIKEAETVLDTYEHVISLLREVLLSQGESDVVEADITGLFKKKVVSKGLLAEKYVRVLAEIVKAKKDYDNKKLTRTEVNKVQKDSRAFIKELIEFIQRSRGKELGKAKIRVKYGEKFGEVILLGDEAFLVHDIDSDKLRISKASINKAGELSKVKEASMEEFEKAITKISIPPKVFIKEKTFERLKDVFGEDVEISVNY
ncbi:nucleotidyltransferase domain-containing protein [Candidatus Woesearchaeota archaeon]|nr:nucleotidyltransferase domain-containing protein [Candidatus Woesearchaeota archaeon]